MLLSSQSTTLIPASDWASAGMLAGGFVILIFLAEILRWRANVEVEWTRKLVHLGGGLLCLSMPFILQSHWTVLLLAISMGLIFVVSKNAGWLPSVHAVKRKSEGTAYYPFVVYVLFLLTSGLPWKFVICMLVLAISDTAAALVGTRSGRIKFSIESEKKSVEGAVAFLVVTVFVVLIPLLVWDPLNANTLTNVDRTHHYLLASVLIGLLVMCFELVSLQGRDNIFIPLGTFLVLTKTLQTDVADLMIQNVSFISMLLAILAVAAVSNSFNVGGALIVCLAGYGAWALGAFVWAMPLFVGYAIYVVMAITTELPWRLTVRPTAYMVLPGVLILAIGNVALNLGRANVTDLCFAPFFTACMVALTQAIANVYVWRNRKSPWITTLKIATAIGAGWGCCLFVGVCMGFLVDPPSWNLSFVMGTTVSIVAAISVSTLPSLPPTLANVQWLLARMLYSIFAGVIVAMIQWWFLLEPWAVT